MTKSQLEEFKGSEGQFSRLLLMKYDYLDKQFMREYEHNQII